MTTTMGLKLSEEQRARLKLCADRAGRTPHFLAKHALLALLDRMERGELLGDVAYPEPPEDAAPRPFLAFA